MGRGFDGGTVGLSTWAKVAKVAGFRVSLEILDELLYIARDLGTLLLGNTDPRWVQTAEWIRIF